MAHQESQEREDRVPRRRDVLLARHGEEARRGLLGGCPNRFVVTPELFHPVREPRSAVEDLLEQAILAFGDVDVREEGGSHVVDLRDDAARPIGYPAWGRTREGLLDVDYRFVELAPSLADRPESVRDPVVVHPCFHSAPGGRLCQERQDPPDRSGTLVPSPRDMFSWPDRRAVPRMGIMDRRPNWSLLALAAALGAQVLALELAAGGGGGD